MSKIITSIFSFLFFVLCFYCGNARDQDSDMDPSATTDSGKWRFSLNGGAGYRTAKVKDSKQNLIDQGFESADVDDYFNQIRLGYKASGQVHYMFWKEHGLGIDYQYHVSSGSISGYVDPGDMVTMVFAKLDDQVYTNYIGLSLFSQSWIKPEKFKLYSQVSFGLTWYREETIFAYTPILITGNAFGGNGELGLEYFINDFLALGFGFNYFQSTLSKVETDNGNTSQEVELSDEQKEGLQRIDMNLGLRLYF